MGYKEKGKVLYLHKALYELKKSPLLWQRHFESSLTKIRFNAIPHKPHYIIKKGILIFFYINNIVFICREDKTGIIKGIIKE